MASLKRQTGRPRPDGRQAVTWVVRWRDPDHRAMSRTFKRKLDASRFAATVAAELVHGTYIDPAGGRMLVRDWAVEWQATRGGKASTAELVDGTMRRWVIPYLGAYRLGDVRPSHCRAFVTHLSEHLAPSTVRVVWSHTAAMFAQAVADRLISTSPCARVPLPRIQRAQLAPLTTEQVVELVETAEGTVRTMVVVLASTGLRAGELLGLTVDRLDMLRRTMRVDRQLWTPASGPPVLTGVKGHVDRTLPLPAATVDALARHLAEHPITRNTDIGGSGRRNTESGRPPIGNAESGRSDIGGLDAGNTESGRPGIDGLVFRTVSGVPWRRPHYSMAMRAAFDQAGLHHASGHDLRHYFASLLIAEGASVVTVQNRLGHRSAAMTLNVYAHLWPNSEDETRAAVDRVLGSQLALNPRRTTSR